jgi:predicted phage terminase large subunit-like protein
VCDLVHFRENPGDTDAKIEHTKSMDGIEVMQRMEEEPGSSGKSIISIYSKTIFKGSDFKGVRSTGSKIARAKPVSAAAYNKNIKVVRAPWNGVFFWELEMFPQDGAHDDIVDSFASAYNELNSIYRIDSSGLAALFKTKPRPR